MKILGSNCLVRFFVDLAVLVNYKTEAVIFPNNVFYLVDAESSNKNWPMVIALDVQIVNTSEGEHF